MGGEADGLLDARTLIEAVQQRAAAADDPLALLQTAITLAARAGQAADEMVEHYVAAARAAGLSWTAIGEALGVSKQAARQRFSQRLADGGMLADAGGVAVAPRLAACLEVAQATADADDSVPGTQHLLLGLLHVGLAASVLDRAGVTRAKVREAAARLFEPVGGNGDGDGDGPRNGSPRVVGDGEAEAALARARRLAAERGRLEVRTEHLLFVLFSDPGYAARRVLNDLGVDPAQIKKDLDEAIPPPPRRRGKDRRRDTRARSCSFCGCTDPDRPMVAGPGIWICADCVALATDILHTKASARHAR